MGRHERLRAARDGQGVLQPATQRDDTDPAHPTPYAPEPVREWHRGDVRAGFAAAVRAAAQAACIEVPALIDGRQVRTADTIASELAKLKTAAADAPAGSALRRSIDEVGYTSTQGVNALLSR